MNSFWIFDLCDFAFFAFLRLCETVRAIGECGRRAALPPGGLETDAAQGGSDLYFYLGLGGREEASKVRGEEQQPTRNGLRTHLGSVSWWAHGEVGGGRSDGDVLLLVVVTSGCKRSVCMHDTDTSR